MRLVPGGAAAWLLATLAAMPAAAQGTGGACRDLLDRFAEAHNLSASPPPVATTPGSGPPAGSAGSSGEGEGGVSSRDLARSGGVVTPPAVGDQAVIEPARPRVDTMPTAPAIRPDADPGAGATGESPAPGGAMGDAAQRAQMEALITAGRAAAQEGDEAGCMDSLAKARRLSRSGGASSGGTREGGG